jgi:uncharacterized protein YcnI
MKARLAIIGALVALAASATPAAAHVQVTPSQAAPDDAVLFQLLVPNERAQPTTKIQLKVPPGVLAYSFEDAPGWKRRLTKGPDGSVAVITWQGRMAPDGFARFALLASTPPQPGDIAWKAVQTYADGHVERWIGGPGSDEPADVTHVIKGTPVQNAGGESAGGDEGAPASTPKASAPDSATAGRPAAKSGSDRLAVALGAGGLILGAVALLVAVVSPRRRLAGRL